MPKGGDARRGAPYPLDLGEAFRRLYYRLYTNSRASRAERIGEDLSLLLLLKLASQEDDEVAAGLRRFERGEADESVLRLELARVFPGLIAADQPFNLDSKAIVDALAELERVDLAHTPAHALGDAFQALIGPRLRGDKGQFFTPRSLVWVMVEITDPLPTERVLDPACGTGGFLLEAFAHQARSGVVTGVVAGVDKNHDLARLAGALVRLVARKQGSVSTFDSLDLDAWGDSSVGNDAFDVVLTNPPFGAHIGVDDANILGRYAFGHAWAGDRESQAVLRSQDPQTLFIELCVRKLRAGGRLAIVLPEGVFGNKQQRFVWHWLEEQGEVKALLDCPRTTFQPGTDTKANVLFFEKGSPTAPRQAPRKTRVAVAVHCGHDRRGRAVRADGTRYPDDFARLAAAYGDTSSEDWTEVDLTGEDYRVPRYHQRVTHVDPDEAAITADAPRATLGQLIDRHLITIRKGHEPGSEAYGSGDIPFVRTSDLANFEVSSDPTKAVSEDVLAKYSKLQRLRPGDILLAVDARAAVA